MAVLDIERVFVEKSKGFFFPLFKAREIAKITQGQIANVRRDLKKLVELGVLKEYTHLSQLTYQLNKDYYVNTYLLKKEEVLVLLKNNNGLQD